MECLQGHCRERRIGLRSQPPLHVRELGREGVQACSIIGRGTRFQTRKLASI